MTQFIMSSDCTPSLHQRPQILSPFSRIRASNCSQTLFPFTRRFRISESHYRTSIKVCDKEIWLALTKMSAKFTELELFPACFLLGKAKWKHLIIAMVQQWEKCMTMALKRINDSKLMEDQVASAADDLEEEILVLPLTRCMRIVPHDQNTVAFFIAVFQKLSPLPKVEKKAIRPTRQLNSNNDNEAEKSKVV